MDIRKALELLINSLSIEQLAELQTEIGKHIEETEAIPKLTEVLTELRFSEGLSCPHCKKNDIICNGR